MHLFGKDLTKGVTIIAEIGVNHEGDPATAEKLLRLAAETGADAVKFQSYTPERYISNVDPERRARVTRFALSRPVHEKLAALARSLGIHFFSTAVTEDWVPFLAQIGSAMKIASGDLTFEPVIRQSARTGKPIILSVGLGTLEEIDRAVDWVRQEIGNENLAERLVLMHCVVAYPTPIDQANVRSIPFLAERYGLTVGYSNHVIGPQACYAAVALGAPLLEVHFTDRKSDRTFRDHALSFEAADIKDLISNCRAIHAALGIRTKLRAEAELMNLSVARKGIVAAIDLKAGEKITEAAIMYARPVVEFDSNRLGDVIGRTVRESIKAGDPMLSKNLQ